MNMNHTLETSRHLAEDAAHTAGTAVQSTRRHAELAIDRLDDTVQQLRTDVGPAIDRASDHAALWARRSAQQLRHGTRQLQAKAHYAAQETQQFVRDQPVKSVLIAAGIGALVLGLVSLLARPGSRH